MLKNAHTVANIFKIGYNDRVALDLVTNKGPKGPFFMIKLPEYNIDIRVNNISILGANQMKKLLVVTLVTLGMSATSYAVDPIITDSTSRSTSESTSTTTVKSPPPTAVAPAITSINSDLCAVAASGAVQTQILGISIGSTFVDKNCERLKISKTLFDMGMKVAAVSVMCQDERVFTAMMNAGTPCPVDGKIGEAAREIWEADPKRQPQKIKSKD
jgi:hypothetical protein